MRLNDMIAKNGLATKTPKQGEIHVNKCAIQNENIFHTHKLNGQKCNKVETIVE